MKNEITGKGLKYVLASSVKRTADNICKKGPWEIGKAYFIRTVTMALHGILIEVHEHEVVLMDAAWIADTARFHDFVTGKIQPSEVEPFPRNTPVIVGRGALIDAVKLDASFAVQK